MSVSPPFRVLQLECRWINSYEIKFWGVLLKFWDACSFCSYRTTVTFTFVKTWVSMSLRADVELSLKDIGTQNVWNRSCNKMWKNVLYLIEFSLNVTVERSSILGCGNMSKDNTETARTVTKCHVPEDSNLQQNLCENFQCGLMLLFSR